MTIKYSILVPVYNVEKYIRDCIESVLTQTYTNYELILVDDGSLDSSGVICDEYENTDKRIRVFHKENQGLIHTRIFAMERAHGDYYIFLDSDDMLKPNALSTIDSKIQTYHCDCLVYGFERVKDGKVLSQTHDLTEELVIDKKRMYQKVFFELDKNSLCRKAVKADIFHHIDYSAYYHLQQGEDLLQSLEIYHNSQSMVFIPDVLYQYRVNPSSIMHNKGKINIEYTIKERALSFLKDEAVFSETDFLRYRDFCINGMIEQIIQIGGIKNRNQQKEYLQQIRGCGYYQNFLNLGITDRKMIGKRAVIFDLFQKEKDNLLLLLLKIHK